MTVMRFTADPYEPSRPLETVPPQMVPLLIEALHTNRTAQLLLEAQAHLVGDDHNRRTCPCGTCNLYRRIRRQIGKEPS